MIGPGQAHVYDYRIDEHGDWSCEGNPVVDPQLFGMLSRSLIEEEGRYFVRCEGEVHPVRVSDAPLWVRYVYVDEDPRGDPARVILELRDGRRELLKPETLRIVGDHALYCRTTSRRLRTRFGKTAYYELARHIRADEVSQRFYLCVGGRRYDIFPEPPGAEAPQATTKTGG